MFGKSTVPEICKSGEFGVQKSKRKTLVYQNFRLNKEDIPSRAYIAFKSEEQLSLFSREYDGHVFRDKTGLAHSCIHLPTVTDDPSGNESQAVVEFAPYQKVPTEKRKVDTRNATIEKGLIHGHCALVMTNLFLHR